MSVNKVILLGRLGKDPELKQTGSGTSVCSFSLATDYQPKEGDKQTTWHNIVAWGKRGVAIAKWLKKGDPIYIEGRIDNRSYDKDGQTKYISEVVIENFQFVGGKKSEPTTGDELPW